MQIKTPILVFRSQIQLRETRKDTRTPAPLNDELNVQCSCLHKFL
jgi:hypothetical protein